MIEGTRSPDWGDDAKAQIGWQHTWDKALSPVTKVWECKRGMGGEEGNKDFILKFKTGINGSL